MSRQSELDRAKDWLNKLKLSRTDRRALIATAGPERQKHRDVAARDKIRPDSSRKRLWRARNKLRDAGVEITGTAAA